MNIDNYVYLVPFVEDDEKIRSNMITLLEESEGFRCVGAYPDSETALKDMRNKSPEIVLMDIISNIIGRKVVSVAILNNEIPTTDITQLQERLDVNCKIDNGDFINLEMQATKMPSSLPSTIQSLINRMTYYLCDLYSSQGIKGKSYDKLEKAYQITLTDFTVFKHRKEFTNHFRF